MVLRLPLVLIRDTLATCGPTSPYRLSLRRLVAPGEFV